MQTISASTAEHKSLGAKFRKIVPKRGQRRFDLELSDQTLCGWLRQSAELLEPLYRQLKRFVLCSKVVGTEDTPVKVLDRLLPHTRTGGFWPYVDDRNHPAVVYDCTPTRERAGPEKFPSTYKGYLQLDAYLPYDKFLVEPARTRGSRLFCARQKARLSGTRNGPARIGVVLAYIGQLYAVEKRARKASLQGDDLRHLRQEFELNKLGPFAWFHDVLARIPAHSIQKLDQLLPHNWASQTN